MFTISFLLGVANFFAVLNVFGNPNECYAGIGYKVPEHKMSPAEEAQYELLEYDPVADRYVNRNTRGVA